MKLEDAKAIVKAAEEGDVELYENYSGRGMYGELTTGVTGSQSAIIRAAEDAGIRTSGFRWDDIGMDMIAY